MIKRLSYLTIICLVFVACKNPLAQISELEPHVYIPFMYAESYGDTIKVGYTIDNVRFYLQNPYGIDLDSYYSSIYVDDSNNIYISGYCLNANHIFVAGYWENGIWHELPNVIGINCHAKTYKIVVNNDNIYVLGWCSDADYFLVGGRRGFWKNSVWHDLQISGVSSQDIWVTDLEVINDNCIILGQYTHNSYEPYIPGYWENGIWTQLKSNYLEGIPRKLKMIDNDLYIIGNMFDADNYLSGYWKNGQWSNLTTPDNFSHPEDISFFDSDIYIVGYSFDKRTNRTYTKYGFWINNTWENFSHSNDNAWLRSIGLSGNKRILVGGIVFNDNEYNELGFWVDGEFTKIERSYWDCEIGPLIIK